MPNSSTSTRRLRHTVEKMIRDGIPNLLRLYLNPYVAQCAFLLDRSVETRYPTSSQGAGRRVFLANSGEEALSGAIKLVRSALHVQRRAMDGLIVDVDHQWPAFAQLHANDGQHIDLIPKLRVLRTVDDALAELQNPKTPTGFVAIVSSRSPLPYKLWWSINRRRDRGLCPYVISTLSPDQIDGPSQSVSDKPKTETILHPDVVVFDDSWVNREAPFGAFAADYTLFDNWHQPGMGSFHSTTFQPNTIASLHCVSYLTDAHSEFVEAFRRDLDQILRDAPTCARVLEQLTWPSFAKWAVVAGFEKRDITAQGHYVFAEARKSFDAIGGVACSLRGHNPVGYLNEIGATDSAAECRVELQSRLEELTSLSHATPVVSGASAIELALKVGLATQPSRPFVLALAGGYAGKTLFALTGTAQPKLRSGIGPLYQNCVYVDPFGPDGPARLERAFEEYPIGIVQMELVQGVGGVRPIPDEIVACVSRLRKQYGCWLLIDEIQTGCFRTGDFTFSKTKGIQPDLLTIGKGISDMMFPMAMTLYSDEVHERLRGSATQLSLGLKSRYAYEWGLRTVVNALRWAEANHINEVVRARGEQFLGLLNSQLLRSRYVKEVRGFGLLVGVELHMPGPARRLDRRLAQLVLLNLMQDARFPVLAGFCQYEPNVIKLTPPLTVSADEIGNLCQALDDALRSPWKSLYGGQLFRLLLRSRSTKSLERALNRRAPGEPTSR